MLAFKLVQALNDLDPAQAILNNEIKVLTIFSQNKLNEIGSLLKATLIEKIKKFDGYLLRFRRSVSIYIGLVKKPMKYSCSVN